MKSWPTTPQRVRLVLGLLLAGVSCSDEATSPTLEDVGSDARADVPADIPADTPAEPDLSSDPDLPPDPDTGDDEDGVVATGTIAGNVFNNAGVTEGTLRVGLFDTVPASGEPLSLLVIETPSTPGQPYEFSEAPVGIGLTVAAILDVGEPDLITDPGTGDLFGELEDAVLIGGAGDRLNNINVEVR